MNLARDDVLAVLWWQVNVYTSASDNGKCSHHICTTPETIPAIFHLSRNIVGRSAAGGTHGSRAPAGVYLAAKHLEQMVLRSRHGWHDLEMQLTVNHS